jgi:hypothetical protein
MTGGPAPGVPVAGSATRLEAFAALSSQRISKQTILSSTRSANHHLASIAGETARSTTRSSFRAAHHPAGSLPMLIARLAMALSFTLVIRPAHHARRQPRDSRIHPGNSGCRRPRPGGRRAAGRRRRRAWLWGRPLGCTDASGRQLGLQHGGRARSHGGQSASRMGNCSNVPGAK